MAADAPRDSVESAADDGHAAVPASAAPTADGARWTPPPPASCRACCWSRVERPAPRSARPPRPTTAVSRCAAATSAATRCCEAAGWRSARRRRRDASVWRASRPASHAQAAGGAPVSLPVAVSAHQLAGAPRACVSAPVRARVQPPPPSQRLTAAAGVQSALPAACEPPRPPRACAPAAGARGDDSSAAPAVTPAASDPAPPATSSPRMRHALRSTHAPRSALRHRLHRCTMLALASPSPPAPRS
jgi:hypothetical protein